MARLGLEIARGLPACLSNRRKESPDEAADHPTRARATLAGSGGTTGAAGTTESQAPALISQNVFSAALLWSREFEHAGRRHDLGRLLPHGITQWGTASVQPVPPPAGYTTSLPFVGWAVAVG